MDNDVWDPEEHANDLNNSKSVATVEEDEIIFKYYNKLVLKNKQFFKVFDWRPIHVINH